MLSKTNSGKVLYQIYDPLVGGFFVVLQNLAQRNWNTARFFTRVYGFVR